MNFQEIVEKARRISQRIKPSRKFQPLVAAELQPDGSQVWENDIYEVTVRIYKEGWPFGGGEYVLIGISSKDGEPRHDWRDFQKIKNQLVGPEWEAIELYPAESHLLDPSNYYMLWCAPKIPVGKRVGRKIANSKTCIAPQRDWHKDDEPKDASNENRPLC